ncbi:DUF3263 domain-containing protein [Microbacterium stercoris]|uniref:DUF3263 domain-containing protein n=1 Tax=Microbacterium stercoris TaxID=2820289 RepID=A0A939QIW9_9MICO|nr:DUF3263 domain-containing protein [Microbacterium stercoris]MBO3663754.1 DUF3263 domain-containing protein [Microbacterium stercoris]
MPTPPPAALLDFERAHPRHSGWKEEAIRRELGLSPVRFYQLLGRAAETLEAMAHDPVTARRIRDRGRRAA